ncbi:MAG: T9SS type A sorting domain-containing protein, partial [Cytophagales bacterium]|nr:T9SS type A sorting domain-containing protein [Cytophagales bacterium]
ANSLLDVRGTIRLTAAAPITVASTGELRAGALTYDPGANTATLTGNGPVNIAGAMTVNVPTTLTFNAPFTANSVTYNASPAFTTANTRLMLGQATITNALAIGANATVTANGALQAGSVLVSAAAPLAIGSSGSLQTVTLNFGTGATGATLMANGSVTVTGEMKVEAITGITMNRNFSAATLTYTSAAGASMLVLGNPAVAGTSANVSGAVLINSPALITANHTSNNALSMGSLTFGTAAAGASLTLNRPTVIGTTVTYDAGATITANNTLTVGGDLTFASGVTTGSLVINRPVSLGGSLSLAGPNNLTGNATNGSLTFTSTASNTTIQSAGAIFNVPVIFNGLAANGTTRGRWTLLDNMTIRVSARFLNGHVIALPAAAANASPFNPNALVPPNEPFDATKPSTTVNSPMMIFETNDGVTPRIYATTSGATSASHVIGYVRKLQVQKSTFEVAGRETSFTFPIGDGTYYRPLTMFDPSSAVADWTARYLSIDPVANSSINPSRHTYQFPLQGRVSDKEFWYLTASASANTRFTVSYLHPNPAIAQSNYYRVDKWAGITVAGMSTNSNNATWKDINGSPTYPGPNGGTVSTSSGMGSSAWFTIARRDQTPLPVRLVSFTGQYLDGQVQLKWQSSSEENTSHFEVEKSADGKNFSPVLTKKAQGNSSTLVSYGTLDNNPLGGTSYYRLKMVDLDGTFEYSKLVSVSSEGGLQVRLYPNPSQGNGINFTTGNGSRLVLKSVSDLFGKQVSYQQRNAGESLQVNFAQPLPAGFYVATLAGSDSGELVKVKFVVQ